MPGATAVEKPDYPRGRKSRGLRRVPAVKLGDLEDNMDVRRLPTVGEEDMRRLQRYLVAWRTLSHQE